MPQKFIFLDRDGVLVKDKGRVYKIEDLEILPGAIDGLQTLRDLGFEFIIVTNQGGIAKGYYKHEDAHAFNAELRRRLAEKGVEIKATYLCPHHPNHTGGCLCRKPGTGMLEQAAKDLSLAKDQTILVGDKDSDIEAGKRWGSKTVRIINDQYPETVTADYRAKDLREVAEIIKQKLPN